MASSILYSFASWLPGIQSLHLTNCLPLAQSPTMWQMCSMLTNFKSNNVKHSMVSLATDKHIHLLRKYLDEWYPDLPGVQKLHNVFDSPRGRWQDTVLCRLKVLRTSSSVPPCTS